MKKILFLFLICLIKLNAYQYLIYENPEDDVGVYKFEYFQDYPSSYGHIVIKRINHNGGSNYTYSLSSFYDCFQSLKNGYVSDGWKKSEFITYYKNDLNLLNDLFTYEFSLMPFLNYLYNPSSFSSFNHIIYQDYEILYNDDGLAVESIVNGVWAGLYNDSQKSKSGALYNKNGSMVYYNGKEVTPAISFFVWLQKFTNRVVIETFEEIQRSLISGIIAAVVLVLAIVRFVLELLPSSITPRRRRYYGGGRGSLPDFGDGRQVSASVRARLAAKNQALKARANGGADNGDLVKQSMLNGLLFDLENDR